MIRNEDTPPPPPYSLHGVSDSGRGQAEPATFAGRIQSSHASDPGKKAGLKLRALAAKLGCGGRDSDSRSKAQRADSEEDRALPREQLARIDRQRGINLVKHKKIWKPASRSGSKVASDRALREQLRIERQARIDRQARMDVHGDRRTGRANDTVTDDLPLIARGGGMILG